MVASDQTPRGESILDARPRRPAEHGLLRRVLVVEPETAARGSITRWCWKNGYMAVGVCHPRQALCAGSCYDFDAAIVDQRLPEMEGLELGRRLKGLIADLKLLVLSGDPNGVDEAEASASGADGFLHLPCPAEHIGNQIELLLSDLPRPEWGVSIKHAAFEDVRNADEPCSSSSASDADSNQGGMGAVRSSDNTKEAAVR